MPRGAIGAAGLLGLAAMGGAIAAPLAPSSGAMTLAGTLERGGRYEIQAVLKDGNFSGTARLTLNGQTIEGPLLDKRSYLENGKCYFRFEQGRARGEIRGKCDSATMDGTFETFTPAQGGATGKSSGTVTLLGGASRTAAAGQWPAAKLTCAYQDRKYTSKIGGTTQYSLAFSNMGSLKLSGSSYATGTGSGSLQRVEADKIRLTSGPWSGAVGTLEPDRSGRPAVVFHIEENRRPDGVHIVDPYTTRCTEARP